MEAHADAEAHAKPHVKGSEILLLRFFIILDIMGTIDLGILQKLCSSNVAIHQFLLLSEVIYVVKTTLIAFDILDII